jgi:crossover junction endodeoxyribonuclease RuvC
MIIMGVDPGIAITGYGFLRKEAGRLTPLDYGVLRTEPDMSPPRRLLTIYEGLSALIDVHQPDTLATERLFFSRNETTALVVGRTIGVVLLLAAMRGIPWQEYTPMEVKQAVVGYGGADKKQVQFMIQRILELKSIPKPDDAADALAVAVCHAHSVGILGTGR